MKKNLIFAVLLAAALAGTAQELKSGHAPAAVKAALMKRYPAAAHVSWEREHGNYEANWGGKSGEDMSVQFSPDGKFVEEVAALNPALLPEAVQSYVATHYKGTPIKEAGKVTTASGEHRFEAEVKGKDLLFDENGRFLKQD